MNESIRRCCPPHLTRTDESVATTGIISLFPHAGDAYVVGAKLMRRRSDCRRAAKLGPGFSCGVHESFRLPELPRSKLYTCCTCMYACRFARLLGHHPPKALDFPAPLFNLCIAPTRACCHITIHGIHVLHVLRHNRQAAHTGRRHDGASARHPMYRLHFCSPLASLYLLLNYAHETELSLRVCAWPVGYGCASYMACYR